MCQIYRILVSYFRNKLALAEGAYEAGSRREEESMLQHRQPRRIKRSPVTPFQPEDWGGTAPISSLLLFDDAAASTLRRTSI
jgi:hypothetical protein